MCCVKPISEPPPFTAQQQQRLAAALLAVLTALAEERHPCDVAWQTATMATLEVLNTCVRTQPALAGQVLTPAGCMALGSLLERLRNCCQPGAVLWLGAPGVGAIVSAAHAIACLHNWLHSIGPDSAAMSCMPELACRLVALVLQLAAPLQHTAGACTCPGSAPTANTAVRRRGDAGLCDAYEVYGATFASASLLANVDVVVGVCHNAAIDDGDTHGRLVGAGWRRMCSMALALRAHAERKRGHPRAFAGADAADLARFVDPALVTPAACEVQCIPTWRAVTGAVLALDPRHEPACPHCLPDQLLLVLETAGFVNDPKHAAHCYTALFSTVLALSSPGGAAAASPLHAFGRRAWPHLAARALEAVRAAGAVPEGSADASHHAKVLDELAGTLSIIAPCQPDDDDAALDAMCEAAARTRPPLMRSPACTLLVTRLQRVVLRSAALLRATAAHNGSPPRTLTAAMVSTSKLLQVHSDTHDTTTTDNNVLRGICSITIDPWAIDEPHSSGTSDAADPAAPLEGGDPQPWVQLLVLAAARVAGAVAQRVLLKDGEALLSADTCDDVVRAAANLQHPPAWDAVQRATHGRMAGIISAGVLPAGPSGQAAAAGATVQQGGRAADSPQRADTHNGGSDGGSGGSGSGGSNGSGCSSACTAALRFLAELHNRLDPHALGVRLPGCYNPRCTNLSGASEADLPVRMCSGCRVARYCSAACSKQHWPWHKAACRLAAGSAAQP